MQKKKWIARLPFGAHTAHARVFGGCTKLLAKRSADAEGVDDVEDFDALEAMRLRMSRKENLAAVAGDGLKEKVKSREKEKEGHPTKKVKLDAGHALKGSAAGVLKGRPILKDLVGNEM